MHSVWVLQFMTGNSLNTYGYIYVPTACQGAATTCALHFNFHGCQQTVADILNEYPMYVGLNEWAESNNIIVVYPQVIKSYFMPTNPEGCWDWWGTYAFPAALISMSLCSYDRFRRLGVVELPSSMRVLIVRSSSCGASSLTPAHSAVFLPTQPLFCYWTFCCRSGAGYTDANYSNKQGQQIKFVEAIMTKIIGSAP